MAPFVHGWPVATGRYGPGVTREEAIRIGIGVLAQWHRSDHGDRCSCVEGEQFGVQMAAVVDAPIAEGLALG